MWRISEYVLHAAKRAEMQRDLRAAQVRHRREAQLRKKAQLEESSPAQNASKSVTLATTLDTTNQQNLAASMCE